MNATARPSDLTDPNAVSIAPELLGRIDPKWHEDLRRFLALGEAPRKFLAYLEEAPECQAAVEEALRSEAAMLPGLGRALSDSPEVPEPAALPRRFDRSGWAGFAAAALIFLTVSGSFVAYQNANIARSDRERLADILKANDRLIGVGESGPTVTPTARYAPAADYGGVPASASSDTWADFAHPDPADSERLAAYVRDLTELRKRNKRLARELNEAETQLKTSQQLLAERSAAPSSTMIPADPGPALPHVAAIEPGGRQDDGAHSAAGAAPAAVHEPERVIQVNMNWPEAPPGSARSVIPVEAEVDQRGSIQIKAFPSTASFDFRQVLRSAVRQEKVNPSRLGTTPEPVLLQVRVSRDEPEGN